VRLASWQASHGIDPADGCVTENTCLVAEGKPQIPKTHKAYDGPPRVDILHPHDDVEAFPGGYPMPLTISVSGPPGPAHVSIANTILGEPRELDVTIGPSGNAILDLRLETLFATAKGEVRVTAAIAGEEVMAVAPFAIEMSNLPPPSRALIGPEPPLPEPGPDRKDIDQAQAESYNRAHVPEVVRFDHATHGYFAKTNGELDALAIAEWQAEYNAKLPDDEKDTKSLAVTGTVDPRTVEAVESHFDGLHPGRDPDKPGQGEHGPIDFDQIYPDHGASVVPSMLVGGIGQTRRHVDVQVEWSLTDMMNRMPIAMGSAMTYAKADGRVEAFAMLDYRWPQDTFAELQLAFVTKYGSTALIKRNVLVKKTPTEASDDEPVIAPAPQLDATPAPDAG
jgi:hypothetical protein